MRALLTVSCSICLGRREGFAPAKLPGLMLVRGLGDDIRGLGIVRVWCITCRQLYRLGLSRDRPGSQGGAHGPPLIFLQVVTSIPNSHRVRSPTSSRMHDLNPRYRWMRCRKLAGHRPWGPISQGGEAEHGWSGRVTGKWHRVGRGRWRTFGRSSSTPRVSFSTAISTSSGASF